MPRIKTANGQPERAEGRMAFRVPLTVRDEIQTAAALMGIDDSSFLVDAAHAKARRELDFYKATPLESEAWDQFSNAMDKPDRCTDALKNSFERHQYSNDKAEIPMQSVIPTALPIGTFDPELHRCTGFSSGITRFDLYLQKRATKLAASNNFWLQVMANSNNKVVGFYCLCMNTIGLNDQGKPAPDRQYKGLNIVMLARDGVVADMGIRERLLIDALRLVEETSNKISSISTAIIDLSAFGEEESNPLTEMLESYGFRVLDPNTGKLFLPVSTIRQALCSN